MSLRPELLFIHVSVDPPRFVRIWWGAGMFHSAWWVCSGANIWSSVRISRTGVGDTWTGL